MVLYHETHTQTCYAILRRLLICYSFFVSLCPIPRTAHLVYVVLLLFSDRLYTLDRMQSLTAAGHGFSREMCTRSSLLVSLASGGVLTPLKGSLPSATQHFLAVSGRMVHTQAIKAAYSMLSFLDDAERAYSTLEMNSKHVNQRRSNCM